MDLESAFNVDYHGRGTYNAHPDAAERTAPVLGTMLASASHVWSPEKAQSIAESIRSSMDEEGEYGRATTLNAMLSGHDADGDGVNDLHFNDSFLVKLGNEVEKIDWDKIDTYEKLLNLNRDNATRVDAERSLGAPFLNGFSFDPLAGVIDVMGAHPNAASEFLAPGSDADADGGRIKTLMGRHNLGDNDWTDQWTEVLQNTAQKYGTEVVPDGGEASDRSKQAAIINAAGINAIGADAKELSENSRSRLADALRVYPWSVDEVAMRGGADPHSIVDLNPGDEDYTLRGLPPQPQFDSKSAANVLGLISENEEDFSKVNEAVGGLNKTRTAYAMAQKREGNGDLLSSAMEHTSATRGFLISSAQANVESDAEDKDARNQMIIDSVMAATTFLPGPGEGIPELVKNSYSYALDRGESFVTSKLQDHFTGNLAAAMEKHDKDQSNQGRVVQAEFLVMMLEGGALSADQKAAIQHRAPTLFDEQGNLRPENFNSENIEELNDIILSPNGALDKPTQDAFRAASDSYVDGYNNAR